MSKLISDPDIFEDILKGKLNKCRKPELLILSKFCGTNHEETRTCLQLRRDIKKICMSNEEKLLEVLNRTGGIDNLNTEKCCVCWQLMGRQRSDLGCSSGLHYAHWSCIGKTGVERCPLCKEDIELPQSSAHHLQWVKFKKDTEELLQQYGINH